MSPYNHAELYERLYDLEMSLQQIRRHVFDDPNETARPSIESANQPPTADDVREYIAQAQMWMQRAHEEQRRCKELEGRMQRVDAEYGQLKHALETIAANVVKELEDVRARGRAVYDRAAVANAKGGER